MDDLPQPDDDDLDDDRAPIPNCSFSRLQLRECIEVLEKVGAAPDVLDQPELKDLRKVLVPLLQDLRGKFFRGLGVDKHQAYLRFKAEKNSRKQQQKAHDKQHAESRALRLARQARLKELVEGDGIMRIADGPAITEDIEGTSPMRMIGDDDASQDGSSSSRGGGGGGGASGGGNGSEDNSTGASPTAVFNARSCYVCKVRFSILHEFYADLCPPCASLNWMKRHQRADLTGRIALVTGARVKIGFQTTLKLLRCGADVVATTRFPVDAAARFAAEPDFEQWRDRLHIHGLDFRDLAALEAFAVWMTSTRSRLDILINNACQTVRRPPAYYSHLMDAERKDFDKLPDAVRAVVEHKASDYSKMMSIKNGSAAATAAEDGDVENMTTAMDSVLRGGGGGGVGAASAELSQIPLVPGDENKDVESFPIAALDAHSQQVDLRVKHSWVLKLEEVPTPEVVEVLAINSVAPYILTGRLKPLMMRSPEPHRFIVNVSAMEGQFYRGNKSDFHPHTNMAKAALNMMTRTSAKEYAACGIYMNAVDTGWINDEKPTQLAAKHAAHTGFQTPIDEIDAAARILDPVFIGVNNQNLPFGKFLKDYGETEW